MSVFQLFYVSSSKTDINEEDILAILRKARPYNSANEITGVLLYRGGIFAQLLEGEEQLIKPLFSKIQRDPRHGNIICLFEVSNNDRIFSNWSMAYRALDDSDLSLINEILSWNGLILASRKIDNNLIKLMLNRFKEKHFSNPRAE